MFRSLRWRLTGWYVLLLAGVLLLFSAGTYLAVRELLLDNIDDVLRHQAALVALALEDSEDTLEALLKVLLALAPAMLLLASGGGLFLADRALAPIDRITRTARRISAENLSGRIGMRGPDDEVSRLARTFDAMLERLDAAFARQRQFTADASHELRTPLTSIIGQIDVTLEQPRDTDSYCANLAAVREQARRLAR